MVRISYSVIAATAFVASLVGASPVAIEQRQVATYPQCKTTTNGEGTAALCGPLIQPLQQLLRFQSANIASSTSKILGSINRMTTSITQDTPAPELGNIVNTATNGLANSLLLGVDNTLQAFAVALTNVQPQCRCDMAYCSSNLQEANAETSSMQPQAAAACNQAKYACAGFLSSSQVDKTIPGCKGLKADNGGN